MISNPFGFQSLQVKKSCPVEAPLVSVLVRVKNEAHAIDAFLASVRRQSLFHRTEVIFLDSGSTDGTLAKLTDFPASVYSIASSEFSFGATCNLACFLAKAPFLSLMSGHIELVSDNTIAQGVEILEKSAGLAAAYYRQIPNDNLGSSTYERASLRRQFPPGKEIQVKGSRSHSFSNAASIFSAETWRTAPFPAVAASEDYLWAEQLIASGGEIFYLPDATVKHSHNETPDQIFRRVTINVDARPGKLRSWLRVAKYFVGVSAACMLEGAAPLEALSYARAHAAAYLPKHSV